MIVAALQADPVDTGTMGAGFNRAQIWNRAILGAVIKPMLAAPGCARELAQQRRGRAKVGKFLRVAGFGGSIGRALAVAYLPQSGGRGGKDGGHMAGFGTCQRQFLHVAIGIGHGDLAWWPLLRRAPFDEKLSAFHPGNERILFKLGLLHCPMRDAAQ